MSLSSFLTRINSDVVRFFILNVLYRKNKLKLSFFKSYKNNRFFIYCVNEVYVGCESINWIINLGEFEKHCQETSTNFYKPKKGDCVVDIGAGLGEESIVFSNAVGPSGRVIAVESNPDVYQVLKEVVNLNKISNVTVLNLALNPVLASVIINDDLKSYLSGSLQHTKTTVKEFRVDGIPLSGLIRFYDINEIDLLKVNIEGAERFLAEEITPQIFENVKNIAISCHDFRFRKEGLGFFKTKELIVSYFESLGYQVKSQSTGIDYIDDWVYGVRKH